MESIVTPIRAPIAGGNNRIDVEANNLIFFVTAASPAITVKDSRFNPNALSRHHNLAL
jgi:hypothetical protein